MTAFARWKGLSGKHEIFPYVHSIRLSRVRCLEFEGHGRCDPEILERDRLDVDPEAAEIFRSQKNEEMRDILEKIHNHLGEHLEQIVIHISCHLCLLHGDILEMQRFCNKKMLEGISLSFSDQFFLASTNNLDDFLRRSMRPPMTTWRQVIMSGVPGLHLHNFFEVLSSLTEIIVELYTNIKVTDRVDHVESCNSLWLFNKEEVEEEELPFINNILAHLAKDPRPQCPYRVRLPKVTPNPVY